jgi:phosphopentomutase
VTKRAIIIVLDSVGVGEMPDAADFGDSGADTLGHLDKAVALSLPNLAALGLGCIRTLRRIRCDDASRAGAYGKCREKSRAKDTVIGHWEMAGVVSLKAFPLFPDGFPKAFITSLEMAIGRKTIGNVAASGTAIIEDLWPEHKRSAAAIVYTSADSVFQVAAHRNIIPLKELYRICETARHLLTGDLGVGRVIARPFEGQPGRFVRTPDRHDYALPPPSKTLLDNMTGRGLRTFGIGKIRDIFAGRGLTDHVKTVSNLDGMEKTLAALKEKKDFSLIFTNLVDTDMKFGHRRDAEGYAAALREFDGFLPKIEAALAGEDLLFITADHGCDPCFKGTDHTREHVPLLVIGKKVLPRVDLGTRESFADIAATISDWQQVPPTGEGKSFLRQIIKEA